MAIIEMPKDATGRWIPLDTKVLYNDRGVEYEVNRFTFGFDVITREGEWTAESYGTGDMVYRLPVNSMHLERPDSLKQLMEDLNRVRDAHDERGKKYHETPVDYIQCQGKRCIECRLHNHKEGETCFDAMMDDIVSRVNRLYIDSNYLAGDSECKSGDKMKFEIIERHIIDVPDSELTDGGRPLGKMTLAEVLDVIAENPRRFIGQYEMYREEVIRLGGKL